MQIQLLGIEKIDGPLLFLKTPEGISFEEEVELILEDGEVRKGSVISIDEEITTVQCYEGTYEMDLKNTKTILKGKPLTIHVSENCLGRIFDGTGKPIDKLRRDKRRRASNKWRSNKSCFKRISIKFY